MPKGPKGEKRPADVIGAAIMVARIATGEAQENAVNADSAAVGRKGGEARASALSAKRRKQIAKKAAAARWKG
jgi:hypothetical protein